MATRCNCKGKEIDRNNLLRPAVWLVPTALAIAVSAPLASQEAQDGRDPLSARKERLRLAEGALVKTTVDDTVLFEIGDLSLVGAAGADPTGVASAAVTEYRYDDGTAEAFTTIRNAHEQEYVQRFRLPRAGTVASVTACFGRDQGDDDGSVSFSLVFYRDSGGRPGTRLASYSATASGLARGGGTCLSANRGVITRQRLGSGDTWLSVRWENSTGKSFAEDHNGPGGTRNLWRTRSSSGTSWGSWNAETVATAYFIRLGVDHGGTTPPPTSGCTPTTTALSFDGGYDVSMCYRTPDGKVGQARSGVWASSQSGILWFFDRENAEVLVKVLDGCAHNNHRWAYVAPVTTLEFNLWITGPNGKRWTHSNRQGVTASTKSDDRAFNCSDESGGGDGGGSSAPDLVVTSPSVSNSSPSAGGSFTFRATVRNQGDGRSAATTLRYYRSSNSTISTSDSQVGTDGVGALSASGTSAESISLRAPSSTGTYYYGACVDSVSGESSTGNNCSSGVRVTVGGGGSSAPDLVVTGASVSNTSPSAGSRFTLRATVRNRGDGRSAATTLRYYRSSNSTISTSDRQVGTDSVGALSASRTSSESISLTAPSSAGTYYYGACVDSVSGESSTNNNCSSGVRVTVQDSSPPPDGSNCRVGQVLDPGESCEVPGLGTFRVRSDGSACVGSICAGGSRIQVNRFRASRVSGTSRWRIDAMP